MSLSGTDTPNTSSTDIENFAMISLRTSGTFDWSKEPRPLRRLTENPGTRSLSWASVYCAAHLESSFFAASIITSRNLRHARRSPRCSTVLGFVNVSAVTACPSYAPPGPTSEASDGTTVTLPFFSDVRT